MFTFAVVGQASTDNYDIMDFEGLTCDDRFSDYFGDSDKLDDLGISGGYAHFEVANGRLYVVTKYNLERMISLEESKRLVEYTHGQWSDGIGESFEQHPQGEDEHGEELYVSMYTRGCVPHGRIFREGKFNLEEMI
jgi:hypothetical protein